MRGRQRRKFARVAAALAFVTVVEALVAGLFSLTGPPQSTNEAAPEAVPPRAYAVTTEAFARKARTAKKRARKAPTDAGPERFDIPRRTAEAAPPSPQAAPPPTDYGRWTVRQPAPPTPPLTGPLVGCDPATLSTLTEDKRRDCLERFRRAGDRRLLQADSNDKGARELRDQLAAEQETRAYKIGNGPKPCPKNEPANRWIIDRCGGIGMKYRF